MGIGKPFLDVIIAIIISTCLGILILSETSQGSDNTVGQISPGFGGAQMNWIDRDGLFLVSNNSQFAFGFTTTPKDVTLFLLVVMHIRTQRVVWAANLASPVSNSDRFLFDKAGKVSLLRGSSVVWSINSGGASALQLRDSGNLVLLGGDGSVVWRSFDHPTDTLLWGQDFVEGMRLVSNPDPSKNLTYFLEIQSGDLTLYVGYESPQPYWSMRSDSRRTINKDGGGVVGAAVIDENSWKFYDKDKQVLLWQFAIPEDTAADASTNATWIAVLGGDGVLSFFDLQAGLSGTAAAKTIPSDVCSRPERCDPYYECFGENKCQCPSGLSSRANCSAGITSTCGGGDEEAAAAGIEMVSAGDGLYYFALGYVPPTLKGSDLNGCKSSCQKNCSCVAAFFRNSSGDCFLFDRIGHFQNPEKGSGFASFVKVSTGGSGTDSGDAQKHFPYVVFIAISTVVVICFLLFLGYMYYKRRKRLSSRSREWGAGRESSDEDNFLGSLAGMPVRFTYADLQAATNNFSEKLGQGGFGSVYMGEMKDGSKLAVKKLEGVGQGKKEFRAEVSIIGSIHHLHLVRLKGFCAEGPHRLLAYEFMAKGSLERWIFRRRKGDDHPLEWEKRFSIAVGTAKGLAYLHEDCDAKIIHCDIKPENVLLDDNFNAKVSDFGLAKLMTREQSHVFTTMRGTRGYLAPEWITNYAISEKSDVYSYGMLLLEIVGGRKNYDPTETSDKSHFPSYAFRMLEEGKLRDILDWKVETPESDERVSTAIKVALWCIQEDMNLRPSMAKVVQMLEGLCPVAPPPTSSPIRSRFFSGFLKSTSDEGTSSGPSEYNSDVYLSAVRLSGPR